MSPVSRAVSESNTVCTAGTTNFLSWYPQIDKCFGPLIPGHSPGGGPAVVVSHYELVVGFQLISSLFIHNQLDALSAVRLGVSTARFLSVSYFQRVHKTNMTNIHF